VAEAEEVLMSRQTAIKMGVLRALDQRTAMSVEYVSRQAREKARWSHLEYDCVSESKGHRGWAEKALV
jgi:hypothetical protein